MPPKRKSDALEPVIDLTVEQPQPAKENAFAALMEPAAKKAPKPKAEKENKKSKAKTTKSKKEVKSDASEEEEKEEDDEDN